MGIDFKEKSFLKTDVKKYSENYDAIDWGNKKEKLPEQEQLPEQEKLLEHEKCRRCSGTGTTEHTFFTDERVTSKCEYCSGDGKHYPERYTCYRCTYEFSCRDAYNLYNINNNCYKDTICHQE